MARSAEQPALDVRDSRSLDGEEEFDRGSRRRPSLLWIVFGANAAVLVLALVLLVVTPITISAPVVLEELAVLAAGFVALLALDLFLLRRILAPLFRLADVMATVDPERPGRRVAAINPHSAEGAALVRAFNRMLDRLERARQDAARTALAAQEAERLRVARELHDEIGQTLTAVVLQAERATEADRNEVSDELVHIAEAVRESLDEVRRISRELRPEALDDLGLVSALLALCSRVEAQGGPPVRPMIQKGLPSLPPEVELVIYRVAQESLTNTVRHARASFATLSLTADGEKVVLTVSDDGAGIPAQPPTDTVGLAGMRERAFLVGGELSITERSGGGTEVELTVPTGNDE